jgi:hypothetical protein
VLPVLDPKALAFPENIFLSWNLPKMLAFLQNPRNYKKTQKQHKTSNYNKTKSLTCMNYGA